MVHKPGHDRPRLRPPARRVVPDRRRCPSSSPCTSRSPGSSRPSKVVAVALNTSLYPRRRRGAPGHRRDRGARPGCRPTTRSGSGPTGCGPPIRDARGRAAVGRGGVTLRSPRGPAPLAPRPVPHRPDATTHTGEGVTTVIVELRDDRFPGIVGVGEGYPDRFYGETPETMAAVLPTAARGRSGSSSATAGRPDGAATARDGPARSAGNGAAKCAIDIALHDLVGQGRSASRSTSCSACSADIPPTDFTIGIDEPAIVAERAPRAAALPGAQDQARRAAGPRDARGRPRRLRRPDPRRCQHRLDARRRRARCCPSSIELGVELIEQPFPARAYRDLRAGSRSARRSRSSPTRAP